jgi:glycosyltransferase involved in cell wall biosynthesis
MAEALGDVSALTEHERSPSASIIIPAHNEERAIGRLLSGLLADTVPGEFEIVVVCNACTDRTAELANEYAPAVRVLDLAEAGKHAALKAGDAAARVFPRLYVDADVELDGRGVRDLCAALVGGALAAAPARVMDLEHSAVLVRAYYAVWNQLPQVRNGLFGRGVVAVSAAGSARIAALPPVMSDDLAMSEAFADDERVIVESAQVVIHAPRKFRDLLRRRTRARIGNSQIDTSTGRAAEVKTSWAVLGQLVRKHPSMAVRVPVFIGVALLSKLSARRAVRRGDFTTWLRDESSRGEQ